MVVPWFSIEPWQPMPLFMLSAAGTALTIVALSLWVAERKREARCLSAFVALGQLTLTLYLVHIIVGELFLSAVVEFDVNLALFPFLGTFFFLTGALLFAHYWQKYFASGPLEWVMRHFLVFPPSMVGFFQRGLRRRIKQERQPL
jgi:uncharacterized membrane protein YeiB